MLAAKRMRAMLQHYRLPLLALAVMALALGGDWGFNRPVGGANQGPPPLIVMDDFHDLELGLVVLNSYGPSRYCRRFTCVEWGGHAICTLPISGYAVVVLLVSALALSAWTACKLVRRYENQTG